MNAAVPLAQPSKSRRPRWRAWITGLLLLAVLLCGTFLLVNWIHPVGTARSLVVAADWWQMHWPLSRGGAILFRLNDTLYSLGVMKPVVVQTQPGMTMELDSRDLVTQAILVNGIWEPRITAIVSGALQKGNVFIDVGAHVGYYSLLASQRVGSTGKVIAIEPNPPTLDRLRRNIHLNGASNIVVEPVACTDVGRTLRFFQADLENTGGSSLASQNARGAKQISVAGVPLDKIVESLGLSHVDFVKIDVEGAEMQVLGGMTNILAKYRPKIVIELKADLLANMGTSLDAALALFHKNGYTLQERDGVDDYFWLPAPAATAAR